MAAKMRYMACVELTTSSKSHKQTGQYALESGIQLRHDWGNESAVGGGLGELLPCPTPVVRRHNPKPPVREDLRANCDQQRTLPYRSQQ